MPAGAAFVKFLWSCLQALELRSRKYMAATEDDAQGGSGFDNPLAATGSSSSSPVPTRAGLLSDIEQALSDGSMSPAQAIVAIESRLSLQQGRLDALETKLSRDGVGFDAAIRATVSKLAEAPMNWYEPGEGASVLSCRRRRHCCVGRVQAGCNLLYSLRWRLTTAVCAGIRLPWCTARRSMRVTVTPRFAG